MLILSNTTEEQTFTIIPRYEPSEDVTITFVSETENKQTHQFVYAATYLNGYLSISHIFSPVLKLNNFYTFKVTIGDALIYRGKAFVTDQTNLPKFTLNDNKFVIYEGNNNEFLTI